MPGELTTLRLAVTLADLGTRTRVSEELAAHVGVERLLVLMPGERTAIGLAGAVGRTGL